MLSVSVVSLTACGNVKSPAEYNQTITEKYASCIQTSKNFEWAFQEKKYAELENKRKAVIDTCDDSYDAVDDLKPIEKGENFRGIAKSGLKTIVEYYKSDEVEKITEYLVAQEENKAENKKEIKEEEKKELEDAKKFRTEKYKEILENNKKLLEEQEAFAKTTNIVLK